MKVKLKLSLVHILKQLLFLNKTILSWGDEVATRWRVLISVWYRILDAIFEKLASKLASVVKLKKRQ